MFHTPKREAIWILCTFCINYIVYWSLRIMVRVNMVTFHLNSHAFENQICSSSSGLTVSMLHFDYRFPFSNKMYHLTITIINGNLIKAFYSPLTLCSRQQNKETETSVKQGIRMSLFYPRDSCRFFLKIPIYTDKM